MKKFTITPIAHIKNDFNEKFGIPRQSGRAPSVISKIIFTPEFRDEDALREIDCFSHLWLIFDFSKAHVEGKWSPLIRPPRLGGNKKVGVFASRSPFRPNNLGLSVVKLISIDKNDEYGTYLNVSGADLLDGTPIFDVKPYLPFADSIPNAIGGYADEQINHKLTVKFNNGVENLIPQDKLNGLVECLEDDPRPSYHDDNRTYGMLFAGFNVKFMVENNVLTVIKVEKD